jgi:hypothetical protein
LGQHRDDGVEVLQGLSRADWVVVEGAAKLKPGDKVEVEKASPQKPKE